MVSENNCYNALPENIVLMYSKVPFNSKFKFSRTLSNKSVCIRRFLSFTYNSKAVCKPICSKQPTYRKWMLGFYSLLGQNYCHLVHLISFYLPVPLPSLAETMYPCSLFLGKSRIEDLSLYVPVYEVLVLMLTLNTHTEISRAARSLDFGLRRHLRPILRLWVANVRLADNKIRPLVNSAYQKSFFLIHPKYILKLMGKKILPILCLKILIIQTYEKNLVFNAWAIRWGSRWLHRRPSLQKPLLLTLTRYER